MDSIDQRIPYMALVGISCAANLPENFKTGRIVGIATTEIAVIGSVYLVDVGRAISEEYPYPVVGIPEIFLTVIPERKA